MNFRPYKYSDVPYIVSTLNICFPKKQITEQSFKWKHLPEYNSASSYGWIAEHQGSICGITWFTPIELEYHTQTFTGYLCAVQATHPDFRRRGIITKLTQYIETQLPKDALFIGFSNQDGIKIDQYSRTISYTVVSQMKTAYIPVIMKKTNIKVFKATSFTDPGKFNFFFRLIYN